MRSLRVWWANLPWVRCWRALGPLGKTRQLVRLHLLVLGVGCIVRGVSYLEARDDLPGSLRLLTEAGVPLSAWAVLWILGGALALLGVRRATIGWSCMSIGVLWGWAGAYLFAFLQLGLSAGWLWFLSFAWLVQIPPRDYGGLSLYLIAAMASTALLWSVAWQTPRRRKR